MAKQTDIANFFKNFDKQLKDKQEEVENYILDEIADELPKIILKQTQDGISPVTGSRFAEYSQSYIKQIQSKSAKSLRTRFGKRVRPVNLKLSGDMKKTFFVDRNPNSITIGYASPLAYYHSVKGAGKSKTIRKLLPYNGESFNSTIKKKIKEIILKASKLFRA